MTSARPTVLLAEDNEDHAFLARRALEAIGAEVTVAPGGPEAIEMVRGWTRPMPDLVALDLSMPMVDGFEVLALLRAQAADSGIAEGWRHVPVVVLSTSRYGRDIAAAYAAGANSYVAKPSSPGDYRAALASLGTYWLGLNTAPARADLDPALAHAAEELPHPAKRMDEVRRILFAEDNEDHAFLIRRALSNTGAELIHASDGDEALQLLATWEGPAPAVVLLDMNMPRMSGLEVLDRIRSDERFPRVPIVIFSTSRLPSDVRRAYDLRANSYVAKPKAFGEFRRVLERLSEYWILVNEV
jgi:two-component system response regulator